MQLIRLVSTGYDRADIEAARQARLPIADNGRANSVAVAERAILLIPAVYRKLAWLASQHRRQQVAHWEFGRNVSI